MATPTHRRLGETYVNSAHDIKDIAVGMTVAFLVGKRAAYLRNTYSFRLGWRGVRLGGRDRALGAAREHRVHPGRVGQPADGQPAPARQGGKRAAEFAIGEIHRRGGRQNVREG